MAPQPRPAIEDFNPRALKAAAMEFLGVNRAEFDKLAHDYHPKSLQVWDEIEPRCFCSLRDFYREMGDNHLASQVNFAMQTWDSRCHDLMKRARSLLDYGCGIGASGLWAYLNGAEKVYLYDLDTRALDFAIWNYRRYGFEPVVERVETCSVSLPKVDMIVCIEVIEHMLNPIETLFEFHRASGNLWITHLLVDPEVEAKDPFKEHLKILPGVRQMIPIMNTIGFHQSPAHPLLWVRTWNPD